MVHTHEEIIAKFISPQEIEDTVVINGNEIGMYQTFQRDYVVENNFIDFTPKEVKMIVINGPITQFPIFDLIWSKNIKFTKIASVPLEFNYDQRIRSVSMDLENSSNTVYGQIYNPMDVKQVIFDNFLSRKAQTDKHLALEKIPYPSFINTHNFGGIINLTYLKQEGSLEHIQFIESQLPKWNSHDEFMNNWQKFMFENVDNYSKLHNIFESLVFAPTFTSMSLFDPPRNLILFCTKECVENICVYKNGEYCPEAEIRYILVDYNCKIIGTQVEEVCQRTLRNVSHSVYSIPYENTLVSVPTHCEPVCLNQKKRKREPSVEPVKQQAQVVKPQKQEVQPQIVFEKIEKYDSWATEMLKKDKKEEEDQCNPWNNDTTMEIEKSAVKKYSVARIL
jgi:hypothetical protein